MKSLKNRWEPCSLLITFVVMIFLISSLDSVMWAGAALLYVVFSGMVILSQREGLVRSIRFPILLLLPLFIFLPFTSGGEVVWQKSFLTLYREGLLLALLIFLKTFAILLAMTIFMRLQAFNETIAALQSLKVPLKLTALLQFTYRYIFLYKDRKSVV